MLTPKVKATFRANDGVIFEIYAYRQLSQAEVEREVTVYRLAHRRKLKPTRTYRIFTEIGKHDRKSEANPFRSIHAFVKP